MSIFCPPTVKSFGDTVRTLTEFHAGGYTPSDGVLLLGRPVDQQIIDVHGHKVVRVNDVELESTRLTATCG